MMESQVYSLTELDNMMPWELYNKHITMLAKIDEEERQQKENKQIQPSNNRGELLGIIHCLNYLVNNIKNSDTLYNEHANEQQQSDALSKNSNTLSKNSNTLSKKSNHYFAQLNHKQHHHLI